MSNWNRALTTRKALIPLRDGEKSKSATKIAVIQSLVSFAIMIVMFIYAHLKAAGF